jgi:hypothetical protein
MPVVMPMPMTMPAAAVWMKVMRAQKTLEIPFQS